MFSLELAKNLASQYGIPIEDVILIALNRYGIIADVEDKRIRFKIKLDSTDEVFYFAICVNTYPSPFQLIKGSELFLNDEKIGYIFDIEKDTCDSTYFRRNKTELTLNSNKRSQCKGCKFCGSYNLDPADMSDLNSEKKLTAYLEKVLETNNLKKFEDLVRVTICTGCFENEEKLIDHILMVNDVFKVYGFSKRIRYIGSQLRSDEAMDKIQKNIKYFSLSLTTECFSKRNEIMRKEKAELDINWINDILQKSLKRGFSTNYLYILGLDSLDVMEYGMNILKNNINRFPGIQILQNFVPEQEEYRITEAKTINYYLEARKRIETIFEDSKYKPRSWENYRGLFYLVYNNKPHDCIRI